MSSILFSTRWQIFAQTHSMLPLAGQQLVSGKRTVMSALSNVPTAFRKAKRVGRGPSSGKGKTSGRGMNGQKQKESVHPWFEGGQTPLHKTLPKIGFTNNFAQDMVKLNLGRLQEWIDRGRINPSRPITMKHLLDTRACRGIKDGVKLLADGKENFKTPINITVSRASKEAIKCIEELGGTVTTKYYNRLALRSLLHPKSFTVLPLEARPIKRRDIEYYKNPEVRGYLSDK
ncbi:ribosomal protein L18e/L15P [Lipomyces kononenkoae]|uniref:Ribosomal protein L18e/L15P n=1 Tax=Lipomyces kononenkoae TaxID=34357 RepID=A0ACC3SWV4_LIPKO